LEDGVDVPVAVAARLSWPTVPSEVFPQSRLEVEPREVFFICRVFASSRQDGRCVLICRRATFAVFALLAGVGIHTRRARWR
jgi:hypothetical protein